MPSVNDIIGLGQPPFLAEKLVIETVQSAVAAAGTAATTATALTADICHVATCSAGSADGVILRTPVGQQRRQVVINSSSAVLKVYPPTGGRINNLAVDANVSVSATQMGAAVFYAINSLDYYVNAA